MSFSKILPLGPRGEVLGFQGTPPGPWSPGGDICSGLKSTSAIKPQAHGHTEEQWQARVDLAAAHRCAVMHNLHEGIFYIDLESFRQNFDEFNVNYDTSSWFLDYFLRLNDTTEETWDNLFCSGCIVNRL